MKRFWLGALLAVFVFATSALVASATTNDGLGRTGTAAVVHTFNAGSSSNLQLGISASTMYLMAAFGPQSGDQSDLKGKDKDRANSKEKFHGAEMSPTAIVLAGVFAIAAYFLFVRRKSQKRV